MSKKGISVQQLVGTAILAALVIILQAISSSIHVGPFTITLVLVPIIIGSILYGPLSGAVLGFLFGVIVSAAVISGADVGGGMLFAVHPVITILICLIKSTAAGYLAGIAAGKFSGNNLYRGVILAAITAPIVNTGLFVLGLYLFFYDILKSWAAGAGQTNLFLFVIVGLVGINFLLELIIDVVLVPVIVRIIHAARQSRNIDIA